MGCTRFARGALDPFVQLGGRGRLESADGFERDELLSERPRELGRGGYPLEQPFAALRWERSISQGAEFAGGTAPHCSTTGSVAVSVAPPAWGMSLTSAMSRTGTRVAIPQLPFTSLNAGRVSALPERVTICSS